MPIRAERLKAHPIWNSLDALGPVLDEALRREGLPTQDADDIVRLKAVLGLAGERLAGLDGQTIHFGHLDAAANAFNEAATQVRAYIGNGNAGHLSNANGQADGVLNSLANLTVSSSKELLWGKQAAEAYQLALNTMLSNATAKSAEVEEGLRVVERKQSELESAIESEKQRITTTQAEQASHFLNAQEGRVREWSEQSRKHDAALAELHRDFQAKLDATSKQWDAALAEARVEQVQLQKSLRDEFMGWAETIHAQMEEKQHQVEDLLGVIGTLGMTAGYRKTSDAARVQVITWQIGTVVALLAFAGIAGLTLVQSLQGDFSWMKLASRLFVSAAFGVLAAYCGTQADRYQKTEIRNRQMALELEALGPFLAPLPKEQQDAFRTRMGDHAFGNVSKMGAGDSKSPTSVAEVLSPKELGDLLMMAAKRLLSK